MTICIALLCDNARRVVAVADRMISVDFLSLQFEQRTKKVEALGRSFAALTAGDALMHTEILRETSAEIARFTQPSVRDVAAEVEGSYKARRQKLAEDTVLCRIGLTPDQFFERQRDLAPELVAAVVSEYQKVELDLDILIVGADGSGAHLYLISDPGVTTCFDAIGYAAIGSGLPHAESFLTEANYSPQISLTRALWLSYVAKRRSERAPGVGSTYTDVLTIDYENGTRFLDDKSVHVLEENFQRYLACFRDAERAIDQSLDDFKASFDQKGN